MGKKEYNILEEGNIGYLVSIEKPSQTKKVGMLMDSMHEIRRCYQGSAYHTDLSQYKFPQRADLRVDRPISAFSYFLYCTGS